jgi:replicative DNA helicase
MLSSKVPVGCVSVEDGRDVVGTRLLSALSNIDSLKIRRKDLTPSELKTLNKVALTEMDHMFFAYPIAGDIEAVERAVDELCAAGCKMIWLDYLQKIRGHNGDRRNEVSETFTRFQRACARGRAAGVAISQFRRLGDGEKEPQIWHLKESGDLENEARIIILAHRIYDQDGSARIRFRLAKSNYGGEGTRWDMKRDDSGSLREVPFFDQHEEDGW